MTAEAPLPDPILCQWNDASKILPAPFENVLVVWPDSPHAIGFVDRAGVWHESYSLRSEFAEQPTHWMDLPKPPTPEAA